MNEDIRKEEFEDEVLEINISDEVLEINISFDTIAKYIKDEFREPFIELKSENDFEELLKKVREIELLVVLLKMKKFGLSYDEELLDNE